MRRSVDAPRRDLLVGLALVGGLLAFLVWSFGKPNPVADSFHFSAAFRDRDSLVPGAPVRISGVQVGQVTGVRRPSRRSGGVVIDMKITDQDALPLREDARLKIRPRLGLEGNDFVQLEPGSALAPAVEAGWTAPLSQTATSVHLDQVLTTLQNDTRSDLQTFLREYADEALGDGGAEAYRRSVPYQGPALRESSIANVATLGLAPDDLSRLLASTARTSAQLDASEEDLRGLVANLAVTARALAADPESLAQVVPSLDRLVRGAPADLESLSASFPAARRFAAASLPGLRSTVPTTQAQTPLFRQLLKLIQPRELPAALSQTAEYARVSAKLNQRSVPFTDELGENSSCTYAVLNPWLRTDIPDPDFPDNSGPVYKQTGRSVVGLAGETRISDADTPLYRYLLSAGPFQIAETGPLGQTVIGSSALPPLGTRPAAPATTPTMRPDVPCETQLVPDLHAPKGPGESTVNARTTAASQRLARRGATQLARIARRGPRATRNLLSPRPSRTRR